MPDTTKYNGIEMGDIASINGQDVPSGGGGGGAYDPVAGTGTYIETIPTSGLLKMGGMSLSSSVISNETLPRFEHGSTPVVNFSSDVNAEQLIAAESKSDFIKISYGRYSACGITASGQLWELGYSSSFLDGNATTTFQQVTGVGDSDTGWTDISVGYDGTMGINSGKLYYLGANSFGQAGTGNQTSSYGSYTQVGTDSDWVAVHKSRFYSVGIKGSGNQIFSCGRNYLYQTGQGTNSGNTTTWTLLPSTNMTNSNFSFVHVDYDGCIAIRSNGEAFGWGDDDNNERFGLNNSSDKTVPQAIGYVGGVLQTDWQSAALSRTNSYLINTSGELYFAGEGQYFLRGDNTNTDAKNGSHVQIGTDTDWVRVTMEDGGLNQTLYSAVAQKGNRLYLTGYAQYGRVLNQGAVARIWTEIKPQDLAAGNVWVYVCNKVSSLQMTLIAKY